jgi:predicted nuclease with RNAse H fold
MFTLGIDLSSAKEGTAACVIEWKKTRAVVREAVRRCHDDDLQKLIDDGLKKKDCVVGIDAPFGWPRAFVENITDWKEREWSKEVRKRLQFRETDRFVTEKLKIWPLSVSTDRIALPAMRANALLLRYGVEDRSGGPKFFEVYPAASLTSWGLPHNGYKSIDPECKRLRRRILSKLRKQLPWLEVDDDYASDSDALDALIASLTVRAAAQGLTIKPGQGQISAARSEGWIHLPTQFPLL